MPTNKTARQPLEIQVLAEVYDSAMARAKSQGQQLATVARTVLFQEAARTPAGTPMPAKRPPRRKYRQTRKTIKFTLDAAAYRTAADKIQASGRSVAAAVEDGLAVYARTGIVANMVPTDTQALEA